MINLNKNILLIFTLILFSNIWSNDQNENNFSFRISLDPVMSFFINGFSGKTELGFNNSSLSLEIPIRIGEYKDLQDKVFIYGAGLNFNKYFNQSLKGFYLLTGSNFYQINSSNRSLSYPNYNITKKFTKTSEQIFSGNLEIRYKWVNKYNFITDIGIGSAFLYTKVGSERIPITLRVSDNTRFGGYISLAIGHEF